jgi:hypothetical protein
LLSGIDALYLGYYGNVPNVVYDVLFERGEIKINGMGFGIKHIARGPYRLVLDNDFLSVSLGNSASSVTSPSVYVQVSSELIWSAGIDGAYRQVLGAVSEIYDSEPEREQVSRVDLFADFAWSKRFQSGDIEKFTTRAKSKAVFCDGKRVSGFTIGKGEIQARIYDKTLEIRRSGKAWLYDLWEVNKDVQVWRVEFQLRREALRDFRIETFEDLLASQQALWNHCTSKWLSVRATGRSDAARRRLARFWDVAQGAELIPGDDGTNLVRRERMSFGMTEAAAAAQMAGITKSYARNYGIEDHSDAFDNLIPRVRERLFQNRQREMERESTGEDEGSHAREDQKTH